MITRLYCWLTNATPVVVEGITIENIQRYAGLPYNNKFAKVARPFFDMKKYGYKNDTLAVRFVKDNDLVSFEKIYVMLSNDGTIIPTQDNGIGRMKVYVKWQHLDKNKQVEQLLKYG